jgi:hypothetical protein
MNRFSKLALAAAIAIACASCVGLVDRPLDDSQPVVNLTQVRPDPWEPVLYGPLTVEYELTVFNPSPHPIVLRAVDLRSAGNGKYTVARQSRNLRRTISPGETISTRISVEAWGSGGQASAYEPVTIQGIAWFAMAHSRRSPVPFETMP